VNRPLQVAVVVLTIVVSGTLLYAFIEHENLLDSLYFTLATVTTVGYGDEVPQTQAGEVLAIFLMLAGVGSALYAFSSVMSFMIEGRLAQILGVRKMKEVIAKMKGHFIVCGYGKLGKIVVRELQEARAQFVILENSPAKVAEAREKEYLVVEGDATQQEALNEAGLDRAAGLATTISDDAENLYIGIAARSMRPDLPVVCRSSSDRVRVLFERAGIERTISIDEIGARRIVTSLLRPHVVEFMDQVLAPAPNRPSLHATRLEEGAALIGQSIMSAKLRNRFGIVVLAIQRDGAFLPNPDPSEELRADDVLILIGHHESAVRLRDLVEAPAEESGVARE
jgi:voltage-gated potassium channel